MLFLIIGSGQIYDYSVLEKYINYSKKVIACDGGLVHCYRAGVEPDYIVGDFDSVDKNVFEYYKDKDIDITAFSPIKDETDLEIGIQKAIELKASKVLIFGAIGSRFDHSLANCHLLLQLLKNNIEGYIINENNKITVIDKYLKIPKKENHYVSLIPLTTSVVGVNLKGFFYPLKDKTLEIGSTLAISNEIIDDYGEIFIKEGYLIVIVSKD